MTIRSHGAKHTVRFRNVVLNFSTLKEAWMFIYSVHEVMAK